VCLNFRFLRVTAEISTQQRGNSRLIDAQQLAGLCLGQPVRLDNAADLSHDPPPHSLWSARLLFHRRMTGITVACTSNCHAVANIAHSHA